MKIFIFHQFKGHRIGDTKMKEGRINSAELNAVYVHVKHLLGICMITVGNSKINLTIQMISVVDEENFVVVDVVLRKTCYRGIRMSLRLDASTG